MRILKKKVNNCKSVSLFHSYALLQYSVMPTPRDETDVTTSTSNDAVTLRPARTSCSLCNKLVIKHLPYNLAVWLVSETSHIPSVNMYLSHDRLWERFRSHYTAL